MSDMYASEVLLNVALQDVCMYESTVRSCWSEQCVCTRDAEQFNVVEAYACFPLCVYTCDAADSTDGADVRQSRYLFLSISRFSL